MRLCFLGNYRSIHTRRWLAYFVSRGHEVYFASDIEITPPLAGVKHLQLRKFSRPTKPRYVYWGWQLRQMMHEIRPDLLHAHRVWGAGWVGWLARYHPFVLMPWGSDLYIHPKRSWLARQLARQTVSAADLLLADSQDLLNTALSFRADDVKAHVVQWGVDLELFTPALDKAMIRSRLGLPNRTIILSPRSMRPVYRHDVTVDAITLVKEQIPDALFVFREVSVSPPGYKDRLADRVSKRGVADHVMFLGPVPSHREVAGILQAADIVVSVSESDGTPISVLESFACGVPVVAGDISSLREWIANGENGFLVPVGDATTLADVIIRIAKDKGLQASVRERALQTVRERADYWRCMAHAERLYQKLISEQTGQ